MKNEKITGDMSMIDILTLMSEGNPGAINVLMQMIRDPQGFWDILLLDNLNIRGSKIWMLYSDCSGQNMDKYYRTLKALRYGAYSREEIQENLSLINAIPFLDDSIHIEGKFEISNPEWETYIKANREIIISQIKNRILEEESYKR